MNSAERRGLKLFLVASLEVEGPQAAREAQEEQRKCLLPTSKLAQAAESGAGKL